MEAPTLTAQERHQLMAVLRQLDAQAPADKRRQPRRKVQLNVGIQTADNGACGLMSAKLINVATGGIGLEVPNLLRKGQRFTLHLRFGEGGGWLVLCEVRNCRPMGRAFRVGAEFLDHIEDPKGTVRIPRTWVI
jgi:hypothetical protein